MRDKYGIVINYRKNLNDSDYKSYFENLIKFDRRIFVPSHIYYCLDKLRKNYSDDEEMLSNEELLSTIETSIVDCMKDYIKKSRHQIRESIKINKGSSVIKCFLKTINKFNKKVNMIKIYINSDPSKQLYNILVKTIFCDPVVNKILKSEIVDINRFKDVKLLILQVKKLSIDFYNEWLLDYLDKSICSIFLDEELPHYICKNTLSIYKYNIFVNYYFSYYKHFRYVLTDKNILSSLGNVLVTNIINDISRENNIQDLNDFLVENHITMNSIGKLLNCEEKIEQIQVSIASCIHSSVSPDVSLNEICMFYITLSKYYSKTFSTVCSLFCRKISQLIIQKHLYKEFNDLIISSIFEDKDDNTTDSGDIKYLIEIISNLSNKDIIFRSYHKYMMLRLINKNSSYIIKKKGDLKVFSDGVQELRKGIPNIDFFDHHFYVTPTVEDKETMDSMRSDVLYKSVSIESRLIERLSKCFSKNQIYILRKTLDDYTNSIHFNEGFIGEDNSQLKGLEMVSTLIASYNIWDLKILSNPIKHVNSGDLLYDRLEDSNSEKLSWKIGKISEQFKKVNPSKCLNYYLHVGEIEVDYTSDVGVSKLVLLPIQHLFLEKFFDESEIQDTSIYDMDFLKGYPKEEISNLLNIFLKVNILKENNGWIKLNLQLEECTLDLREEYFKVSSLVRELQKKDNMDLCHDPVDIIKTLINSTLKSNNYMSISEIFQKCKDELYDIFEVTKDCFDEAINYLVKNDYIEEIGGENYQKIFH